MTSLLSAAVRRCRSGLLALALLSGCVNADVVPEAADIGLTGALSRVVVQGRWLYTVDGQTLRIFDLGGATTSNTAPQLLGSAALGVDIESVYPIGSYLFVGTAAGLYLFDVAVPQQPRRLGHYAQAVSCDPLVVEGRWAYITLRPNRSCGGGPGQLQVVDLQNPAQPQQVQAYPLTQPYGLALHPDSARLFVCDAGLRVFDTRQAPTLRPLDHFAVEAFDVEADRDLLLVSGSSALYQYRYTRGALQRLSALPISRP